MKTKNVLMILAVLLFAMSAIFAQPAYEQGYSEGWDAAKKDLPYQMNVGMTGYSRPPVSGQAVVHAGTPEAAAAGFAVLAQGGNAFDAALAAASTQTFSEAMMCSIFGGDAEIITYDAKTGKVEVYNGTGWAPKKAEFDFYLEQAGFPSSGPLAMQMPGEWSGWMTMLRDKGSMELSQILAPAASLAENGLVASEFLMMLKGGVDSNGNEAIQAVYPKGLKVGDVITNQNYANLLKKMGEVAATGKNYKDGLQKAEDYFYRGPVAEDIVAWNNANGGIYSIEDFNEFHAEKQEPWTTNYRGYDVFVCPPNCQGATLIEALNILENFDLSSMEHNSAEYVNIVVQALNIALNDRNHYLGDPRFITPPTEPWTKEYAKRMAGRIDTEKAMQEIPEEDLKFFVDYNKLGPDTTFMAVCDAEGNMCVVTHSINGIFGSVLMDDKYGIIFNNRMSNFSLDEESPNVLVPHKRPMQTITPTLALKDGAPAFFVGTPNANNQEQTKLQVILNYVDFGYRPQSAVEHPRFATGHAPTVSGGNYSPAKLTLMNGFSSAQREAIAAMGYKLSYSGNTGSLGFGIYENGKWTVGADPTRTAYSVGL